MVAKFKFSTTANGLNAHYHIPNHTFTMIFKNDTHFKLLK